MRVTFWDSSNSADVIVTCNMDVGYASSLEKAPIPLGTRGYTRDFETCRNNVGLCILAIMLSLWLLSHLPSPWDRPFHAKCHPAIFAEHYSHILWHYSHLLRISAKRSMRFRAFSFSFFFLFSRNVLLTPPVKIRGVSASGNLPFSSVNIS